MFRSQHFRSPQAQPASELHAGVPTERREEVDLQAEGAGKCADKVPDKSASTFQKLNLRTQRLSVRKDIIVSLFRQLF